MHYRHPAKNNPKFLKSCSCSWLVIQNAIGLTFPSKSVLASTIRGNPFFINLYVASTIFLPAVMQLEYYNYLSMYYNNYLIYNYIFYKFFSCHADVHSSYSSHNYKV
ncbi:hypothetical protein BpHYR1_035016 [Brachionus plicatilis]|uniref:Uncharacterized protein n=1 Tax=Brachionus plicatilis TaxID=10195 RepID=A0A3M7SJN9_BRAPC|nr:hypothetical protein BpHYR1_035016 [Brachionus plicatilis]